MSKKGTQHRKWYYLGGAGLVLCVLGVGALGYFGILNIPFVTPHDDTASDEHADEAAFATESDKDMHDARVSLQNDSLDDFLSSYDKVIQRTGDNTAKAAFYYNQRASELMLVDTKKYQDQIIADITKANELNPSSPAAALLMVDVYTTLGDTTKAAQWQETANERSKGLKSDA